MQNGIIKGNGASRYLKTIPNASTLYPTYEDFILALTQGTFTIDFNGINESGWSQIGTELNKANLLSDETCALLELDTTESVPDDALQSLYHITAAPKVKIATGSYTGDGTTSKTVTIGFEPMLFINQRGLYANAQYAIYSGQTGRVANSSGARAYSTSSTGITMTTANDQTYILNINESGTVYYWVAAGYEGE